MGTALDLPLSQLNAHLLLSLLFLITALTFSQWLVIQIVTNQVDEKIENFFFPQVYLSLFPLFMSSYCFLTSVPLHAQRKRENMLDRGELDGKESPFFRDGKKVMKTSLQTVRDAPTFLVDD